MPKPRTSLEEAEAVHEEMKRQLAFFEKELHDLRIRIIRQGKVIELVKRVRRLKGTPNMQKIEELAGDVGL